MRRNCDLATRRRTQNPLTAAQGRMLWAFVRPYGGPETPSSPQTCPVSVTTNAKALTGPIVLTEPPCSPSVTAWGADAAQRPSGHPA
jgi:hypothetical protein